MHACSVPQSCLTLCNPVDCSPPDSSVPGIPQARILDLVAISYCRGSSRPGIEPTSPALTGRVFTAVPPGKSVSENRFDKTEKSMYKFLHLDLLLLGLHWTVAQQALCPWDFPAKNTGEGCHFLFNGIFPGPGIELVFSALADGFFITEPPRKPRY